MGRLRPIPASRGLHRLLLASPGLKEVKQQATLDARQFRRDVGGEPRRIRVTNVFLPGSGGDEMRQRCVGAGFGVCPFEDGERCRRG